MYKYKDSSEELKQGSFDFDIGSNYHYIKIGSTNINQLKSAGILPRRNYKNLLNNKPDGLFIHGKNEIRVLVEYKKSGVFQSEKEAREKLYDWYYDLGKILKCNVICMTDGDNTFWFHVKSKNTIKTGDGKPLNKILNAKKILNNELTDEEKIEWIKILDDFKNVDEKGKLKKQSTLNPQNLAKRVWQKIWINTGKEPEKCLYNVVEIFIFKFLSDLGVLTGSYSFNYILKLVDNAKNGDDNNEPFIQYSNLIRVKIRDTFPKAKDGTTIINGTIFVTDEGKPNTSNASLFNEVIKEFADFEKENGKFTNIDKNFKTRLYENFLRQQAGIRSLGQYFTPRNVVKPIIDMVGDIDDKAKVCDPFCGVGGFLLELLNENENLKKQFEPRNGKIKPKTEIIGIDKGTDEKEDQRTIILAKANMLIYFSDYIYKYKNCMEEFSNEVFNKTFHLENTNTGTLGIEKYKDYFDLILTNPPYVSSGVSSIKKELDMDNIYPSNGTGLEGLAIEWIIRALKPKGKAFIIVPDGVLSRQSDRKLREKILKTCYINALVSLPSRTFYATPKKTFILAITKKEKDDKQDFPFMSYLITDIGETKDSKRFETDKNDLIQMANEYRYFMTNPKRYKTDNMRCKIQNIDRLKKSHWLIDKDWDDDEKKELGLLEEKTEFTETEFYDFLKEIGDFINEYV